MDTAVAPSFDPCPNCQQPARIGEGRLITHTGCYHRYDVLDGASFTSFILTVGAKVVYA